MLPRLIHEQQCFRGACCHHLQVSPSHSHYITLRMDAASSSETFVHICQSIQCYSTWWELSNSLLRGCLHTNQLSRSFCNLVHSSNKLFLMVCYYKTLLLFYLQKFTLKFSQNYLDLCRFWVQDRQIRGLMKVGKTGWSEHTFIIQYIYLYYCSCCCCCDYYYYYFTFVKNQLLNCWFCIYSIWPNLKVLHHCQVCMC